jgi:predicted dehydrogenase
MIRDWVQGGSIGAVREVIAYSRKNYWTRKPLEGTSPIPKGFDWDLFLNRAEMIPFHIGYINREWIRFSHFSGVTGDMGAHILDGAYYSLDLRVPLSVHAKIENPPAPGMLPKAGVITWEFGARGGMPPVTMKYYLGPDIPYPRPKRLEEDGTPSFMNSGSVIVGERASITVGSHSQGARIIPEEAMRATPKPEEVAYRCRGRNHYENWTNAIKGIDKEAMSNFEYAGPLSEINVLGDVAMMHPNVKLMWDAKNMKITNNAEADKSMFMRRLAPRDHLNWI